MQTVKLIDRKTLELTDVLKVISFNSNEFILSTNYGNLVVLGKNLTIDKMDTFKKELTIAGDVDSISYSNKKEEKKESVFAKIFK